MNEGDENISAAIAAQASERFVANDGQPLDARESAALAAWLKASPVHVEEFLGVAVIARDLKDLSGDPEYSVDAVLERARAEDASPVRFLRPSADRAARSVRSLRWQTAAVAMVAFGVVAVGVFSWRSFLRPIGPVSVPSVTALHLQTRHGEQLTRRLPDNSVLHLNTDSAVTIRYGRNERVVMLTAGQAAFEVVHESNRAFQVLAGPAEVVDLGTQFDVRLERDAVVVTVVEGRVGVRRSPMTERPDTSSDTSRAPRLVEVSAGQQLRMVAAEWPPTLTPVDTQRSTAWLHRQIVFESEPLERVAVEFNRYAPKPIEIVTPALRNLQISGVFAIDDTDAFVAFLRKLKGVQVEVTPTQIRVSQK